MRNQDSQEYQEDRFCLAESIRPAEMGELSNGWHGVADHAGKFQSIVFVGWGKTRTDAKDLAVDACPGLSLGDEIRIEACGADAAEALRAIKWVITSFDFVWQVVTGATKDSAPISWPGPEASHMRPVMQIVDLAGRYKSHVTFYHTSCITDAKSVIRASTFLCSCYGQDFEVRAIGNDAVEAVMAMVGLFKSRPWGPWEA